MNCRLIRLLLILLCLLAFPHRSPAPLIYRPGEGWTYEPVGSEGKWQRAVPKTNWMSLKRPLTGRITVWRSKRRGGSSGFGRSPIMRPRRSTWWAVVTKPRARTRKPSKRTNRSSKTAENRELPGDPPATIRHRQQVSRRQVVRLWGVIPFFPSMEKTSEMYAKIVKSGPYSDVAPQAQLNIGAAREKQKSFPWPPRLTRPPPTGITIGPKSLPKRFIARASPTANRHRRPSTIKTLPGRPSRL